MSANAMRYSRTAWWSWLISSLTLLAQGRSALWAAEAPLEGLPADVERLVKWLPEDTETLVVARTAVLTRPDPMWLKRWSDVGMISVTESLSVAEGGPLESILGRRVELAVRGARNFDGVTSFGGLRSEGCAIFTLATNLDAGGRALARSLRKHAASIRSVAGRDVYVFPSAVLKEPWTKPAPWEGAFFVVLDPRTLLYATSDRYLAEVLGHIDHPGNHRALPDSLPEWKHVNFAAPSWIVRHYPREDPTTHAIGMTAAGDENQMQVVYTSRAGAEVDPDQVRHQWASGQGPTPERRARFRVERRMDGAAVFATLGPPEFGKDPSGWPIQLCNLQAMDVAWGKDPRR